MQPPTTTNRFAFDAIIVFLAGLFLFLCIVHFIPTDIQAHAEKVAEINKGTSAYPPVFLYYLVINLISFFSGSKEVLLYSSALVLSGAVTMKYLVTKNLITDLINDKKHAGIITLLAACCLLIFVLPDTYSIFFQERYYYGRIVPNVWHNSTTIAVFPFALLLFREQYHILSGRTELNQRSLFLITGLVLMNILIKPSFFFVYAPVTVLMLIKGFGVSRKTILNILPIIGGIVLIIVMELLIYRYNVGSFHEAKSAVIISKPFYSWTLIMPKWYIPLVWMLSFLLPLSYFFLYRSWFCIDKQLGRYAIWLLVTGFVISIMLAETGPRRYHGNFLWQNVICSYILHVLVITDALKRYIAGGKKDWKMRSIITLFFLYVLSGLGYFTWMFVQGSYF